MRLILAPFHGSSPTSAVVALLSRTELHSASFDSEDKDAPAKPGFNIYICLLRASAGLDEFPK
jgi:hypothetical protein